MRTIIEIFASFIRDAPEWDRGEWWLFYTVIRIILHAFLKHDELPSHDEVTGVNWKCMERVELEDRVYLRCKRCGKMIFFEPIELYAVPED